MRSILFVIPAVMPALLLGACAKSTDDISAQYVSPLQYSGYSCRQMRQEMQRLSRRVSEISGVVNKQASDDNAQMAIGLILLWPTLFALDGDTPQAAEYARLSGEFDALEQAAIQKNCQFSVERPVIKRTEQAKTKATNAVGGKNRP